MRKSLISSVVASLLMAAPTVSHSQWVERPAATSASFRGLSVVTKDVVWVSGTKGTFLWTVNGGEKWTVGQVPGAESFDFRDVHAVSIDTVYLMAAGQDTARIYKTTDRGVTWKLQYNDTRKGVFLDAISFSDSKHGLALGDPINGRFMVLRTDDGGEHWAQVTGDSVPTALTGEAAFAASGTSLAVYGQKRAWFATGGAGQSRIYISENGGRTWAAYNVPVTANAPSKGIFSIAFWSESDGVAVGGDYAKPDTAAQSVAITSDGGKSWKTVAPSNATGYLSGVAYHKTGKAKDSKLVAVGTHGTAVSADGGRTWKQIDKEALNTVVVVAGGSTVWAVGDRGKIVMRSDL